MKNGRISGYKYRPWYNFEGKCVKCNNTKLKRRYWVEVLRSNGRKIPQEYWKYKCTQCNEVWKGEFSNES